MGAVASAVGGGGGGGDGGKGGGLGGIVDSVGSIFSGAADAVSSVVEPVVESVGAAAQSVATAVSDAGVAVDNTVNDVIPGGWATVGAIAATVATMGAAGPAVLAADAAVETAAVGAEVASVGAEVAVTDAVAVAGGEATAEATAIAGSQTVAEVGGYVGETAANFVGPSADLIGGADVAAADAAAQEAAVQSALQSAGTGALKGAGITALKDVATGQDITPEGLLTGAATGAVGGGIGNYVGGAAQGLASANDLGQYASQIGGAASGIAGGVAGGATAAELSGRDPLTGAIAGGISGLTGAAGAGLSTGLQAAGVDPYGAGLLANTALGAGKAAMNGGDPLTAGITSGLGSVIGTGINAATGAIKGGVGDLLKDASSTSTMPTTTADITQSPDYQTAIALGYTPDQATQYAQNTASDNAATSGPSPYAPLASNGETQLVTVSPAPATTETGTPNAPTSKEQLASDLADGTITPAEYNKDMSVIDPTYVPTSESTTTSDLVNSLNLTPTDLANQQMTDVNAGVTSAGVPDTYQPLNTGPSESSQDFPSQIVNNPDGSVTSVENDGTQFVFMPNGDVLKIGTDGTQTMESKANATADATKVSGSGLNLGNLASSLLGNLINNSSGKALTGAAALGAGIVGGMSTPQGWSPTDQVVPNSSLNWQSNPVVIGPTGESYGQQIVNPVRGAEGGFITPTVGQAGFNLGNSDPTNAVQMYSHGGLTKAMQQSKIPATKENMDTAIHLAKGGAPMHHIMGFLGQRMAQGGVSSLGGFSDGGQMLKGPGDGMSDSIPASIGGQQEARLADSEFVIPADVVSHLGNGSSDAGAKVLYNMMDRIRKARTGHTKQGKQINAEKFMPKVKS